MNNTDFLIFALLFLTVAALAIIGALFIVDDIIQATRQAKAERIRAKKAAARMRQKAARVRRTRPTVYEINITEVKPEAITAPAWAQGIDYPNTNRL